MEKEIYRITEDLMLGDLKIVQDKRLYRFTSDSILLSRFADSYSGEVVADFCAGSEQGLAAHIAVCRHEIEITLEEIIATASRLLKYGGRLCICQKLERFTDVVYYMRKYDVEPCVIDFVRTEADKPPYLVMIKGVKGKKPQLKDIGERLNQ